MKNIVKILKPVETDLVFAIAIVMVCYFFVFVNVVVFVIAIAIAVVIGFVIVFVIDLVYLWLWCCTLWCRLHSRTRRRSSRRGCWPRGCTWRRPPPWSLQQSQIIYFSFIWKFWWTKLQLIQNIYCYLIKSTAAVLFRNFFKTMIGLLKLTISQI